MQARKNAVSQKYHEAFFTWSRIYIGIDVATFKFNSYKVETD